MNDSNDLLPDVVYNCSFNHRNWPPLNLSFISCCLALNALPPLLLPFLDGAVVVVAGAAAGVLVS